MLKEKKSEFLALALFLVLTGFFVFAHEQTHASVFEDYGCNGVDVSIPDFDESLASTSAECPESAYPGVELAQQNVEAAGYQLIPLYLTVVALYVTYIYNENLI